jgi:hypothetical protein
MVAELWGLRAERAESRPAVRRQNQYPDTLSVGSSFTALTSEMLRGCCGTESIMRASRRIAGIVKNAAL